MLIDLKKLELYTFFNDNVPFITLYSIFIAICSFLLDFDSKNPDTFAYSVIFSLMVIALMIIAMVLIDGFNIIFSSDELSIVQVIDRSLIFISATLLVFPSYFIIFEIISKYPVEAYWAIFGILFWLIPLLFVGSNRVIAKTINTRTRAIISILIFLIVAFFCILIILNVSFETKANYLLILEVFIGLIWMAGFNISRFSTLQQLA